MKVVTVVIAATVILASSIAHAQTGAIVLKMSASTEPDPKGMITITLASGQKITLSVADVDTEKTYAANGIKPPTGPRLTLSEKIAAVASKTPTNIRQRCEEKWKDDFQMRVYCEEQQREAMDEINRRVMTSPQQQNIRIGCENKWGGDFQMRNYCEEQQLEALTKLGR